MVRQCRFEYRVDSAVLDVERTSQGSMAWSIGKQQEQIFEWMDNKNGLVLLQMLMQRLHIHKMPRLPSCRTQTLWDLAIKVKKHSAYNLGTHIRVNLIHVDKSHRLLLTGHVDAVICILENLSMLTVLYCLDCLIVLQGKKVLRNWLHGNVPVKHFCELCETNIESVFRSTRRLCVRNCNGAPSACK